MSKVGLFRKIFNYIISTIFIVLMIMHFIANPEYTSQIISLFMIIAGLIKIAYILLTGEYHDKTRLHEIISAGLLVILGIIYILNKTNSSIVCLSYGLIDAADGIAGTVCTAYIVDREKITIVELLISIGDIIFGTLLCAEKAEGMRAHLIFLTTTIAIYTLMDIIESFIVKQKRA